MGDDLTMLPKHAPGCARNLRMGSPDCTCGAAQRPVDSRSAKEVDNATKHVVAGGSTRSEQAPAYHLIPTVGIRRIAYRFGMGAERHGEGNWKKSIHAGESEARAFCQEAYNHMIEHAMKMANRHRDSDSDDDLGAIGWAVCAISYAEDVWRKPWTELAK